MPQLVLRPTIIAAEDVSAGDLNLDPEALSIAVRRCDRRDCYSDRNLSKCGRCKTVVYCSKECQRQDWPQHKSTCLLAASFMRDSQAEPPLQHHLRLWTARFNGSLVCATIVALELNAHPSNIDNFGLVINLRPRPHTEAGARFDLVSAVVTPMLQMYTMMGLAAEVTATNGAGNLLGMHMQQREMLKRNTHGQEDFSTVLVVAHNEGPHAIPGAVEKEVRFKPIAVQKRMVRSAALTDPTLDWYTSLHFQVQENIPNHTI